MTTSTEQVKRHQAAKRKLRGELASERGCRDCGERDPVVLHFHHPDRTKKHPNLKKKKGWAGLTWAGLREEAEKCVVLCANCHLREEYNLRKEAS